ncbi:MAG: RNA 2',3'-cyclic phosphodiesterase [Gammaproteobacteria bacterium]|nr:RNA 2',3'-cyclic phosphodiesterase [Gammaproteobacteria bacterium]
MKLPPVIRIFFAIDLPQSAKAKLSEFISQLKKKSKSHAIRWTRPENLHITLQFLAEVKTEDLPLLSNQVRAHIEKNHLQLGLTLGSLALFPHPYRPRVIVFNIFPQDKLNLLSQAIGKGIVASHYEIEDRPFRPHLTLGRIKHTQGIHLQFLSEIALPKIENIPVNEVVLFRSEPQPEGSAYTPLERIAMGVSSIKQ